MTKFTVIATTLALATTLTLAAAPQPVQKQIDLKRYSGVWFEQVSLPVAFERDCACSTAEYQLDAAGGYLKIRNECYYSPESHRGVNLKGYSKNKYNSKLEVYFGPFGSPYDIYAIGDTEDYGYVMVGEPSLKNMWILSRKKQLDETTLNMLIAKAKSFGYNLDKLHKDKADACADKPPAPTVF